MQAKGIDEWRRRVEGTNINSRTLLATDYLNHFNEIVMLLEMLPDIPECLEDARAWRPKSYVEHFADSSVADRELAILVYLHAPECYRLPFEQAVVAMNEIVTTCLGECETALSGDQDERLRDVVAGGSAALQHLIDRASAMIHGREVTLEQAEIDALIGA